MTSIGETLRRERLRRSLDLNQISRELKISAKMLEAIEAGDFAKLPGTIFAKNFVRQYAHLLGLDEDEMAAEVQRTLQPPTELPRFAEGAPPSVTPIQVPRVEEWETLGGRSFSWSSPLPALALFVVAMLVCSGVYAWYQRTRHPVLAQNSTAVSPVSPPQPAPAVTAQQTAPQPQPPPQQAAAEQPAAGQVPTTQAQPVQTPVVQPLLPAAGAQRSADPTPAGPVTVRVQITAAEASWVLVRSDGKYLFSGTLEANQTRTVEASKNLELRLGNAGGVTVMLNGSSIGAVGPKGQVRTVQFTSGGFQIVAAPKSAPLIDPL